MSIARTIYLTLAIFGLLMPAVMNPCPGTVTSCKPVIYLEYFDYSDEKWCVLLNSHYTGATL
jgi:hypothetical protein